MKFKVSATSVWDFDSHEPKTKLIKEYPCLKNFGFENILFEKPVRNRIRDEEGRLITQFSYEPRYDTYITIDTIEQLLELIKVVENPLVITENEIEIYDGYRE